MALELAQIDIGSIAIRAGRRIKRKGICLNTGFKLYRLDISGQWSRRTRRARNPCLAVDCIWRTVADLDAGAIGPHIKRSGIRGHASYGDAGDGGFGRCTTFVNAAPYGWRRRIPGRGVVVAGEVDSLDIEPALGKIHIGIAGCVRRGVWCPVDGCFGGRRE